MSVTNPSAGANLPPRPPNPPNTSTRNGAGHTNPAQQQATNQAPRGARAFTSKLRSAHPLNDDQDSVRIRARVVNGGTAAQIAEEGYRVCRVNALLRRDLDDARRELHTPLSKDNDTARIKNRLEGGATAKEIAEEAYRVCRINAYLKKGINGARGELRLDKKANVAKEDALKELRSEYPEMRKVLQRAWGLIEQRKIKIPQDLSDAYEALMAADPHDWQARKGKKNDVRLTKKEANETRKKREEFQRNKSGKGKGKAKEIEEKEDGKVHFLLHTHNGKTYDLGKPMEDQESDEEDTPSEAGDKTCADSINTVAPIESALTATNVVAGAKRKNDASPEPVSKKAKPSEDSSEPADALTTTAPAAKMIEPVKKNPFANLKRKATEDAGTSAIKKTKLNIDGPASSNLDFWESRINLTATECWDKDVKLSPPPFPFVQGWDKKKVKAMKGDSLEDGKIKG